MENAVLAFNAVSRKEECERLRADKIEVEREVTRLKAATQLDPSKSDLSGHPQYQRVSASFIPLSEMGRIDRSREGSMSR